ncbi:MAG: helix-turn-helix domain-containing protein [Halioglobus sp.]
MDMDNTTNLQQRLAMAKTLYSALQGIEVDLETRSLSAAYSKNLFTSPWRDEADATTQAYAGRFFKALPEMGAATGLSQRWQHCFDADNNPGNPDQARAFISDFFRVHLHHPRDYHNFVCQRREVRHNGVLDFSIEHPISVEFWAIYITIEGSATLTVEGESIGLAPNSIVIVPPGCNCVLARQSSSALWCYDWLSFRSRLDWLELLGWARELTKPVSLNIDSAASFEALTQQTEQLESTTYLPDTLSERLCTNIIENILLRIRLLAENTTGGEFQVNRKVQGAVDFILNHYREEITLEIIADHVNSSPSRLGALFREHFGISVIKWRDQIRMHKARELIEHSQEPIGAIANSVGYPDALHFSRRFKDHFGVAPSHTRSIIGGD